MINQNDLILMSYGKRIGTGGEDKFARHSLYFRLFRIFLKTVH